MISTQAQTPTESQGLFSYLPIALFGSVMGLTGLSLTWRLAHSSFNAPLWISNVLEGVALISFITLVISYTLKAITNFTKVRSEFMHPIAGSMFGTPLISMLLIPILLANQNLLVARGIWVIGAIGMTLLAWFMILRWISIRQQFENAVPAWIVPVVGMIDIPLAVPALGWANELHGFMVFATAVGLFFAIPLFTIIVSRLMFAEPLPPALQPSLLILTAPFAVGFSAYTTTVGQIDGFAQILYMLMLFVLAIVIVRMRHLAYCCPFRVSWWAVSFPLAASANAALRYTTFAPHWATYTIAVLLLGLASLVIMLLLIRTVFGILRGELKTLST